MAFDRHFGILKSMMRLAFQTLPACALALTLGLAGCSSSAEPEFPDEAKKGSGAVPDASPPKEALPPGTIARRDLDLALMRGPGWLLSRVQTEEVLRQNKFIGWRLISFPADWDGSGLQPGDVVTDVNGTVLERPDDLWNAWIAATDATEIKITFERDGKPAATVVKIMGAPQPDTRKGLEAGLMAPSPPPSGKGPAKATSQPNKKDAQRFDTKVIGGEADPVDAFEY